MINRIATFGATLIVCGLSTTSLRSEMQPATTIDQITLKSGKVVGGLITHRSHDGITLQTAEGDRTYRMEDIQRIQDQSEADLGYVGNAEPGDLPPWRVIINDIRNSDAIREFFEIPPVRITNGAFANVPYLSFRGNERLQLNIFGPLDSPTGLEISIYGPDRNDEELQKLCRTFLATFLSSRGEVGALYEIPLSGGERRVGPMVLEVGPTRGNGVAEAWRIAVYNTREIERLWVPDEKYTSITIPAAEVLHPSGMVRSDAWDHDNSSNLPGLSLEVGGTRVNLRGFYRDENGSFQLLQVTTTDPEATANGTSPES